TAIAITIARQDHSEATRTGSGTDDAGWVVTTGGSGRAGGGAVVVTTSRVRPFPSSPMRPSVRAAARAAAREHRRWPRRCGLWRRDPATTREADDDLRARSEEGRAGQATCVCRNG